MLLVAVAVLYGVGPARAANAADRDGVGAWEPDAVAQAGHAHQEADRGADDREHEGVVAGVVGDDDDPCSDQGWNRVEPAAQDGGDLAARGCRAACRRRCR